MTLVMKFGGSSVADPECLGRVAGLVREALPEGPLVVLSALGGATDALFAAARAARQGDLAEAMARHGELAARHRECAAGLFAGRPPAPLAAVLEQRFQELEPLLRGVAQLRELTPRSLDAIAATGELLSSALLAALLDAGGVEAEWFDIRLAMRTDETFGAARPDARALGALARAELAPRLRPGRAVITQGYIGATAEGLTTTLGRGGSDYTAALLGAALHAREVQIWTDVEGVLTCDPRVVADALPIPLLSFAEAGELACFGAKVLHPATIQPAVEARIPVTVRNTSRPRGRFTTIREEAGSRRPVTALASRGPITVLTVTSTRMLAQPGYLACLFEVFARHRVSIDLVATAEVSVSCTVEADAPLAALVKELSAFSTVETAENRAIVAIVGDRLRSTPGIGARAFQALGDIPVEMISMGANKINLSLVVAREAAPEALRRLHRAFFAAGGA